MFKTDKNFIKMLDLGILSNVEDEEMNFNKIENRKRLGRLLSKSRQDSKLDECYYCGRPCSSFCNSHSVPSFCLKNISVNGEVFHSNKLVNLPLLDYDKGVKESGTFHLICRECDSKIFSDYENPNNYENKPTSKMFAQITMKNYLKSISKRLIELPLYDNINSEFGMQNYLYEQQQDVNTLDLNEYIYGFKRAKKVDEEDIQDEYFIFYYEKLNYVVPLTFQGNITLLSDFEGVMVNDIYNMSPDYHTKDIHICIFPLEHSSIIMMFIENYDKTYRRFYRQFKKLSHSDKLAAINYIIFCYSEDVFISKDLREEVLKNEKLIEVSRKSTMSVSVTPIFDPSEVACDSFNLSRIGEIPNLLLEEYKVK